MYAYGERDTHKHEHLLGFGSIPCSVYVNIELRYLGSVLLNTNMAQIIETDGVLYTLPTKTLYNNFQHQTSHQ